MILNISESQRLRKIQIDTGYILIIETHDGNGSWMLADSSEDNSVVIRRMVEWGLAKDQKAALDLLNQGSNKHGYIPD